ncbi:MAG: aminotransferase class I/II-fold pyridoxal phosphate-dependent enzyme [Deltaproteobacteria bacterium]|nr:aminotransferase class I/II-fold pyridoxal phosphate-dependent enzyme [Deltaproteobacteria bacterium]
MAREKKDLSDLANYKKSTHLIHGKFHTDKWEYKHHVIPPITSSAAFRLDTSQRGAKGFFEFACDHLHKKREVPIYIYDRLDEPTRGLLEENLAYAEGSEIAVTFSSGMAAVSAACCILLKAGDEVLAHEILYGCTYSLLTNWLPRFGIKTRFANLTKDSFEKRITPKTRVVYFETPINPNLQLIDIRKIREVINRANAKRDERERISMVIDNTFATPFCQRPLEMGADIVVHSLTKDIGGFGTDMGGAVMTSEKYESPLFLFRKDFGAVISPKSAWPILVYGLPTLQLRMKKQEETALKIASFLENHPKVARVSYPGLKSFPQYKLAQRQMTDYEGRFAPGSMIYFVLKEKGDSPKGGSPKGGSPTKGGNEAAEKFIDHVARKAYTITLAVSLGQIRTLIENPFSMTHSALPEKEKTKKGIEPGGIRLSIGLEDADDLVLDLKKALTVC